MSDDPPASEEIVGPPIPPQLRAFDPGEAREKIRGYLALGLVGFLLLECLTLLISVVAGWLDSAVAKDLVVMAVNPILGLASAAVGFYYGTEKG